MPNVKKIRGLNLPGIPLGHLGLLRDDLYLYLLNGQLNELQSRSELLWRRDDFLLFSRFEPRTVQPVASRCIIYAILASFH